MSDVQKHQYMHEYPFIATQQGTRQLTRHEERLAHAYLLGIVEKPTQPMWVVVASGIAIIAGVVVGITAYLSYIF